MNPNKTFGFTLIEILIVMAIITIVSTVVTLSIHYNQNKQIERISKQITRLLELATEEATLRSVTFGIGFTVNQMQFYLAEEKNQKIHWKEIKDGLLKTRHLLHDINIDVKINNESIPLNGMPSIIITPGGDSSDFVILLGEKALKPLYLITNTAGRITSSPYPPPPAKSMQEEGGHIR